MVRRSARWRWFTGPRLRLIATAVTAVLVASAAPNAPALAAPDDAVAPTPQRQKSVRVNPVPVKKPGEAGTAKPASPKVSWPAPGAATVDLPARDPGLRSVAPAGAAKAGNLPVYVGPASPAAKDARPTSDGPAAAEARAAAGRPAPAKAKVEIVDRKAVPGNNALVFKVSRADGGSDAAGASVEVDTSAFKEAYGGDWAGRLKIHAVPDCATRTPERAECRPAALPTRVSGDRIAADVPLGAGPAAATFAVAASAGGINGSFSATSLSPASTWSAGGSTGDFSWSYPLRMPPSLGGPGPNLSLSYSSGSVDGRTSTTNNQPSWIGNGFDMWPGFIERRYKSCVDDGHPSKGDLCWGTDNATMSLNGRSSELVRDSATGVWRPRQDDGSRIERLADTGRGNGDTDGEHWRITTIDGTQYHFGLNRLPGWAAGATPTHSTWTAPVYGDDAGEPCHAGGFEQSSCQQAWRWNLDYVVDPHGNTMSYWYTQYTNKYAQSGDPNRLTQYVRGGFLDRIDYGSRDGEAYSTVPVGRVVFTPGDRCLPGSACNPASPQDWPDTPWDQQCANAPCVVGTPSFWTTKRLAKITTQVKSGTALRDVDSWTLRHEFPDSGGGVARGLWLAGITHTGHVDGSASMPEISLRGEGRPNRIATDARPLMNWHRLTEIRNESGGETRITYSAPDCVPGSRMPAAADSNTLRCHPVKGTYPQDPNRLEWYHKYVVTEVVENDLVGGGQQMYTQYRYEGTPAWHFDDDDGLTPVDKKSWAQWRGYGKVRVIKGGDATNRDTPENTRTAVETTFFRGMNGDKLAAGGTKTVTVTDSQGGQVVDDERYAGMARETITRNGVDGVEVSGVLYEPWKKVTATAVHPWATIHASVADVASTQTRRPAAGGGVQRMRVDKTFNDQGVATQVHDHGDTAVAGDDRCTTFTYARNEARWMLTHASRVRSTALPCGTEPTAAAHVISDVRTSFDGGAWGAAPQKGDVTRAEELASWPVADTSYVTVSRAEHDAYGRIVKSWDATGELSETTYEPATGGPLTAFAQKNPLGHTTRTELEPAWGVPLASVDANNRRTEMAYDALGRLVKGWQPGRSRTTHANAPHVQYEYGVRGSTAPTFVKTRSLLRDGRYSDMIELYDGFLRPRQTQLPSPNGGRVLADTVYNSLGQVIRQNGAYWNNGAPFTTLVTPVPGDVQGNTRTWYDGAGRVTVDALFSGETENWRTTKSYVGSNRVDITPPRGGTATTAIMDAEGRTTHLRQYHGPTPTGSYDETRYDFDSHGRLSTVTDPAGNVWRTHYDLRGRTVRSEDPDKGATDFGYDEAGRLRTTRDARNNTLYFEYDRLGRPTQVRNGSATGSLRTSYTYDTLAAGLPTSSSRWIGSNEYKSEVTGYDVGYRPTGTRLTLPVSEVGFDRTYEFTSEYNEDGTVARATLPKVGNIAAETLTYGYDLLGNPLSMNGALKYVTNTYYDSTSKPTQFVVGGDNTTGKRIWLTFTYESSTDRLVNIGAKREVPGSAQQANVTYTYDPAGNVTKVEDKPSAGTGVPGDTQCFAYDHLRRMKEAWTPAAGDCATQRTAGSVGGPAPYWTSYEYDKTGNRTKEVRHAIGAGQEVEKEYTYPAPGQPQPHTLRSVVEKRGGTTRTLTYGYDELGNTTNRPNEAGAAQTLTWDAEGHLETLTEGGDSTSFVYDASGNRLIRRDADGSKTLYLGGQELKVKGSTVTGTRYYSHAGSTIAVRTDDNKVSWLSADRFGSAQLSFDSTDLGVTRRRFTPFGEERTAAGTWPGDKGFVGGTKDPTGLTHLGAREYDPVAGRFISIDPIVDVGDPQQMHGYAYANNSPVTSHDASGLRACSGGADCDDTKWRGGLQTGNNTSGTGGGTGGGNGGAPSNNQTEEANKIVNQSTLDVIKDAGVDILFEVLGINDIRNCFTKGDVMACVNTAAMIIPWAKVAKIPAIAKAIHKAWKAYTAFKEKLAWAKGILARAAKSGDEAADAARESAEAGAKKGGKGDGGGPADEPGTSPSAADDAASTAGESCKSASFAPGTGVLMADGSEKPIDALEVGDRVIATDPQTGETSTKPISTKVGSAGAKLLVDITIDVNGAADGSSTRLTATDNHPFWLADEGKWQTAIELKPGNELRTADGARVRVISVDARFVEATVHNLTVTEVHTYYVVAAGHSVLVHNCGNIGRDQGVAGAHPEDHVGKSDAFLEERALTSGKNASSLFADSAQETINAAIAANRDKINKWVARSAPPAETEFHFRSPTPIGRVARPDGTIDYAHNITLVLKRVTKGYQGHAGPWVLYTVKLD